MIIDKRDDYIHLVEKDYFNNVVLGNIDAVVDCFTDDCLVTIRHGDNPLRIFRKNPKNSELPLQEFYSHLCGNFSAWFGDFIHYVDLEVKQCACTFVGKLTPKLDSDYLSAGMQTLHNCNFFTYEDDKIKNMTIYYSNTEAKAGDIASGSIPTGYPKA